MSAVKYMPTARRDLARDWHRWSAWERHAARGTAFGILTSAILFGAFHGLWLY